MAEYIEREKLIEHLKKDPLFDLVERYGITGVIEAAPAADVRTVEWIPVTEQLPKEGEFVLVCGDLYPNKAYGCDVAVSRRLDWNYWQGFGRERDITHWMPLPTPPKEEAT